MLDVMMAVLEQAAMPVRQDVMMDIHEQQSSQTNMVKLWHHGK